ncbi:MAG: WGR domain-containing protein [Pirellulaceae bacterium]
MAKRTLQFDDGDSRKFWTISLKGASHTVTFGRIGTTGQTRVKEFNSAGEARKSYDSLIREKLAKGYVDPKAVAVGGKKVAREAPKAGTKKPTARKKAVKKAKTAKQRGAKPFWEPLAKRDRDRRPALTPTFIKAREKSLGIRFPVALKKLLLKQNGGNLVDPEFLVGGQAYDLTDIPPLGGINSLAVDYADHLEMAEGKLPEPELIFPLCGDGHWFLAMDYRNVGPQAEPEIIYLDIEGRVSCVKVADSFNQFLAGHQTGNQRQAVSFNEIDPDTLIAKVDIETTHKLGKTAIVYRARLCLTEEHVILYTYESWKKPRGKVEETWERAVAELRQLNSDWVKVEKLGGYFAVPTKTLYVPTDRHLGGVCGMTCERKGTGGWKNRPFGPLNYLKMTTTDVALLEKCRKQILKAYRQRKK